jgi:hypothetical protein
MLMVLGLVDNKSEEMPVNWSARDDEDQLMLMIASWSTQGWPAVTAPSGNLTDAFEASCNVEDDAENCKPRG